MSTFERKPDVVLFNKEERGLLPALVCFLSSDHI